ncbi:hypothetical protein B9479_007040 [Cryptococcus floricola]|uniref:Uncharacterized protein n=1 Tax=Cryptococcus floricola TaxID=2591691 RepID=A0A5D3ARI9_9TREE|nr:hypothetical protein B9479_007040 [Cryptococcus floricola]
MAEAIKLAGHGKILGKVQRDVGREGGNGACTTQNCRTLFSALQWAADPSRRDVKVLALIGGGYSSNGIALNTIEHASSLGQET